MSNVVDSSKAFLTNPDAIKAFADVMDGIDNIPGFAEHLMKQFKANGLDEQIINKIPGPMRGLLGITNQLLKKTQWAAAATLAANGDYAGALEIIIDKVGIKALAGGAATIVGAAAAGATFWSGPIAIAGGIVAGTLTYNVVERGGGMILDAISSSENRQAFNHFITTGSLSEQASTVPEKPIHLTVGDKAIAELNASSKYWKGVFDANGDGVITKLDVKATFAKHHVIISDVDGPAGDHDMTAPEMKSGVLKAMARERTH
ncbi:MAG: hypothetical protein K2X09_04775 [Rickettsiales bacterium]|nr:hypothetical protein [Rickettsiales bacterium]